MKRLPPGSTRTEPLFPCTTLFRSALNKDIYSGSEIVLCAVTRVAKELLGCATGRRIACHAVKTTAQAVERFVIKPRGDRQRSEEPTSELKSLMRISYAVFCLTKINNWTAVR